MSTKIDIWTQQSSKVKDLLFKQQRLTVKKRYIKQKYGSEAKIFLKAYEFFVKEAPEINVKNATEIKDTSVKLNGEVLGFNDFNSVEYKFQYRQINGTEWTNTSYNTLYESQDTFSRTIYGLNPNIEYEFRINYKYDQDLGEVFNYNSENTKTFQTYSELNVNTLQAENITAFSSKLNGNLTTISYYDEVDVYFQYRRIG